MKINVVRNLAVLFFAVCFAIGCENPFFPEKKDNGGNGGAICLCCDTDKCECADCDNGGCVECDTGSTPCTCCDPDECECDDCDNGDCAGCDAVLTPIESLSVTVTPPVKGETPDVTAVVVDDGNYIATVEWNPAVASVFLGETVYTAVITLTADAGYTFADGLTGTVTINGSDVKPSVEILEVGSMAKISNEFVATLAKEVSSIEIESQPANLIYAHGDTLDLTGLVIKLNYSDTTTENIALADFEEIGITTSPANGVTLSRPTHDGEIVSVAFGSFSIDIGFLTVNKADPEVTWPVGLEAGDGWKLSAVVLPSNPNGSFAWKNASDFVGAAGDQSHNMTFTPFDDANYNTLEKDVVVTVIPTDTVRVGSVIIDMVWIPAGTFQMGQSDISDARPVHQVTLTSGFFMGKYEITQAQWDAVMPSRNTTTTFSGLITTRGIGANYPMYFITWFDALEFCNILSEMEGLEPVYVLTGITRNSEQQIIAVTTVTVDWTKNGYRLPTEAQWEYACRAGTTTIWSYGDTADTKYMWYSANSGDQTQPVGITLANPWGLYDMHGNVREWCWDLKGEYTDTAKTDPTGVSSGDNRRVLRGGGWGSEDDQTRSANRFQQIPDSRFSNFGFRIVRP